MLLERVREFLLPGEAERDQGFRRQIDLFSVAGLRILGYLDIVIPAIWLLAAWAAGYGPARERILQGAAIASVGLVTVLLSMPNWARRYARPAAAVSAWLVAIILTVSPAETYFAGQIALLMLVTVAAIPLRPMHTFAVALAITVPPIFIGTMDPAMPLFLLVLGVAGTGLTAFIYSQRTAAYRSQSSALIYERAASLGKLAAAVSHELSSPIGVLTSSVDTLLVLAARQATAPPSEQQKLVTLQAELRQTVGQSTKRLQKIVARMQGLTNLEETAVDLADLNELLREVAAHFDADAAKSGIQLEMDLEPLPPLACRPRQLSAVFSSLLSNAAKAINSHGRIVISSRDEGSEIEIRVQDNGRGVPASEIETIFDPGFMEKSGRISTRNWSLFSARQIILEHGGEIRIDSQEGRGTTVVIALPATGLGK